MRPPGENKQYPEFSRSLVTPTESFDTQLVADLISLMTMLVKSDLFSLSKKHDKLSQFFRDKKIYNDDVYECCEDILNNYA